LRVRVEQVALPRVELLLLAAGDAVQAERAHEPVDLHAVLPGELGHATGGRAAVELELPEAVLRDREALPEREVGARLGDDPRDAQAVAANANLVLDSFDREVAARLR
jgi:hypothetical protein